MARGKPNPWVIGTLGVAIAALVTDRFLTDANADEAVGPGQPGLADTASADGQPAESAQNQAGPTLSERFGAFADESGQDSTIADAFGSLEQAEPQAITPQASSDDGSSGLRLTAILRRNDGNIAVINGRPIRVGQSIDGIRVVSIGQDQVTVESQVGPITLTIDRPTLSGR